MGIDCKIESLTFLLNSLFLDQNIVLEIKTFLNRVVLKGDFFEKKSYGNISNFI